MSSTSYGSMRADVRIDTTQSRSLLAPEHASPSSAARQRAQVSPAPTSKSSKSARRGVAREGVAFRSRAVKASAIASSCGASACLHSISTTSVAPGVSEASSTADPSVSGTSVHSLVSEVRAGCPGGTSSSLTRSLCLSRRSCADRFSFLLPTGLVAMASSTTCNARLCSSACNLGPGRAACPSDGASTAASADKHSSQPCSVALTVLSAAITEVCCSSDFCPPPSTARRCVAATTSEACVAKRLDNASGVASAPT
mmetsp:Transcript_10405/g.18705  ORF Transcript_10405/g.18705 Transcript_10405/m.18705 type:complete len:256 (+) Transcript_10405:1653-2420(+)